MPDNDAMTADLRTALKASLDEAAWDWLIPHAKRNAVIVVVEPLELLDVAVAIAKDDAVLVENWISRQLISKPSQEQLSHWNDNPAKRFESIIVQPYVVVKELPSSEESSNGKV